MDAGDYWGWGLGGQFTVVEMFCLYVLSFERLISLTDNCLVFAAKRLFLCSLVFQAPQASLRSSFLVMFLRAFLSFGRGVAHIREQSLANKGFVDRI